MVFEYSDLWLLQSICNTESEKGSDLTNLIAFADYVNHAIMTFDEFSNGLAKLITLELVSTADNKLFTSVDFKNWRKKKFESKKSISISKEIEEIGKYLKENYGQINKDLSKINIVISKDTFDKAVSDYLAR
jgi:hypothetical protein